MNKSAITIVLGFVVVFAAGAVVGMVQTRGRGEAPAVTDQGGGGGGKSHPDRHADGRPDRDRDPQSFLARALKLSDEQREQIRQIWQGAMVPPEKIGERRQAVQKERDDAIQALLTGDQRAKFEQINKRYQEQQEELRRERTVAFQSAVEATRKILTEEQRQKYDEIRARWDAERERGRGDRGPRGERPPGPPGPPGPPPGHVPAPAPQ